MRSDSRVEYFAAHYTVFHDGWQYVFCYYESAMEWDITVHKYWRNISEKQPGKEHAFGPVAESWARVTTELHTEITALKKDNETLMAQNGHLKQVLANTQEVHSRTMQVVRDAQNVLYKAY